jgi:hypothetical protein
MQLRLLSFALCTAGLFCPATTRAADSLDLSRAVIVAPKGLSGPEQKAVTLLADEVEKRTQIRWEVVPSRPERGPAAIVVGTAAVLARGPGANHARLAAAARLGPEGYRVWAPTAKDGPAVVVAGRDARGVLFGVGRLLRALRLERRKVTLPADFDITSEPRMPLRGHQLGYRPKTNSYDGWDVAMWEQYIRDLAVFGTNAVELIPPRSDDAADSPHFPLAPMDMMVAMSGLLDAYGLDTWIWYPAMDRDYADPKTVDFALREWGEVFRKLPRIDAVFVPGGDPGHTAPKVLFALLEKQTANLRKYHPRAQMWVSPQGFSKQGMDEFLALVRTEPPWLAGLVYGPQVRMSLAEFRTAIPKRYPIRNYPDITHSRHCQYPVPDWDLAFALTQGREGSNPRPRGMANIFQLCRPHTAGFLTYSEGCHDDVNKIVWSALGWDDKADVPVVLREYARYFIGPEFEERFADGLLGLERDWRGPILDNAGIDTTLKLFQALEKEAGPRVKRNWRFQQALYRAYYDGFIRARLRHETELESAALGRLREARKLGALKAVVEAEDLLERARREPVAAELRARVFELAEALFQSICAQLSVARYQAIARERGANLDSIDVPFNNEGWLRSRFRVVRTLRDEEARLAEIEAILKRTDPGPGGFYDALGDPGRRPHLLLGQGADKDPDFFATPLTGFGFRGEGANRSLPTAWWRHAEALYDAPLQMRYRGLDPKAAYRVRVVYGRERRAPRVRLMTGEGLEVHGYLSQSFEPLEFDVPQKATASGQLTLTWTQEPGTGGTGRGCPVCEVWLLKKPGASKPAR